MQKFKALNPVILVTIILSVSCGTNKNDNVNFGWGSRLMSSRAEMNCSQDNLVLYNQTDLYRFRPEEYKIVTDNSIIGQSDFNFTIEFLAPDIVSKFDYANISFCQNGKEIIGRGNRMHSSNLPAACHFFYRYDESGKIELTNGNQLICFSTPFLTPEEYAREVLGIEE